MGSLGHPPWLQRATFVGEPKSAQWRRAPTRCPSDGGASLALFRAVQWKGAAVTGTPDERGMVAFMPWVSIREPIEVKGVRLLPYDRDGAHQPEPVRTALGAYRDGTGEPVRTATLIEVNGSTVGELDEAAWDRVFLVRDLLCFMGLRHRAYFDPVAPYWNADSFQLIVQRFVAGQGGSFAVPRTRGGRRGIFSSAEVHVVRAPLHVNTGQTLEIDAKLLRALDAASSGPDWEWLEPFLRKLSSANTDSSSVAEHAELVDSVGALQQVVGQPSSHKEPVILRAFLDLMAEAGPSARTLADCERSDVAARYPRAASLRECWFKDLYGARGPVAHGYTKPPRPFVWSITEHLLLAAYLLPRLALVRLARAGLYVLSDEERDEIGAFDYLLCLSDLHGEKETDIPHWKTSAWRATLQQARWDLHGRRVAGTLPGLPAVTTAEEE